MRIPRETDGPWPELPDRAPDDRDMLISKNDVTTEELTKSIGNTFSTGLHKMRLTQIMAPVVDPEKHRPTAKIGFGEALPRDQDRPQHLRGQNSLGLSPPLYNTAATFI